MLFSCRPANSKRLAACAFRHKLSAFLCRFCCPAGATLLSGKQSGTAPRSCRLLHKGITHETLDPKSRVANPQCSSFGFFRHDGISRRIPICSHRPGTIMHSGLPVPWDHWHPAQPLCGFSLPPTPQSFPCCPGPAPGGTGPPHSPDQPSAADLPARHRR